MTNHLLSRLDVFAGPRFSGRQRGILKAGSQILPCAIGRSGIKALKREGDGASPKGEFRLLSIYYRADRLARLPAHLPMQSMHHDDGWCDDPASRQYNRPVRLPQQDSHEELWRADTLYDIVIVLDYNIFPKRRHRGSAIFFHNAREDFAPTAGCIALRPSDMARLVPRLSRQCRMVIHN